MPKRTLRFAMLSVAVSAAVLLTVNARRTSLNESLFRDVLNVVGARYINQLSGDSMLTVAARGLIAELDDPYARLYSAAELTEFTSTNLGHYGGVGMSVEERERYPTVVKVFPNTPASESGFAIGDVLIAIDGESTLDWPLEKTTSRLRGEIGSRLELRMRDLSEGTTREVAVRRARVRIPAVPYHTLIGSTGYIPLTSFSETASADVHAALQELRRAGAQSLIIDIRGNGGGVLEQAVKISDLLLPAGLTVVTQHERRENIIYRTNDDTDLRPASVIVLVNRTSASASEILAGALQDHGRAVIVGEPTHGKGVVQSTFEVGDGYVLKLTTGKWYTPSGRSIQRPSEADSASSRVEGGISPDLVIENDSLSGAERALALALRPEARKFYLAYTGLARELTDSLTTVPAVKPAWRAELYNRMTAQGVTIPRSVFDEGASYIDYLLRYHALEFNWGSARALQETLPRDRQLQRALALLAENPTEGMLAAAIRN